MLKITTRDLHQGVQTVIEGRLVQSYLDELRGCWRDALLCPPAQSVVIDRRGMTHVDEVGKAVFARMHGEGARLYGSGVITRALMIEIAKG